VERVRTLIAIPVFNEVRHVPSVLSRVLSYHPDVLVVDDGSSDGTSQLLARRTDTRLLTHEVNSGYGKSLIDAFAYAAREGFDWVLTMDCDEQHEPEMIPAFLDLIAEDRWDLISGSRYMRQREDDDAAPRDRAAINACLTRLLNHLYPLNLTDAFCGFKAHRVAPLAKMNLTETGYAFPMQLWPQVRHAGLRLTEMSVRRIYVDPNRTFGAHLDQPVVRLQHYMDVLAYEHCKLFAEKLSLPDARDLLAGMEPVVTATPLAARFARRSRLGCGCR
jgi:glycosyltransferase involved in cell wall biosynthesis